MKLLIAAGGTGGHIFPGLAVAEAFIASGTGNEVLFVGTPYGLERKIIPTYGFRLLEIEARPFAGQSILLKLATLMRLIQGILHSVGIMRREKPNAVIGMGGFTSVPVMLAAYLLRLPCFLHEQNVFPGLATRLLSRLAKATFVSFSATSTYLKGNLEHTGNPIRKNLRAAHVPKKGDEFAVFVFGGSRGARSINEAILLLLPYLESYKNTVMYHQTGTDDYEKVKAGYAGVRFPHEVFPFTDSMEKYYSLADVVISRAGASTIFELAYFRKAAILVPYPFAAGAHQWKNAAHVEQVGGAHVIANEELSGERLHSVLKELHDNREAREKMARNIGSIYVENASESIVRGIAKHVS